MTEILETKRAMILRAAAAIGAEKWTPAEIDQLRRKLLADHGAEGKTGSDYIADVLQSAGWKVVLTQQEEAEDQFEEAHKRAEKEEIANWFRIWLENPDAFFEWLEVRKQTPEFREKFPKADEEE